MKFNNKGELTVGKVLAVIIFVVIAMALIPIFMSNINKGVNDTTPVNRSQASTPLAVPGIVSLLSIIILIGIVIVVILYLARETSGL